MDGTEHKRVRILNGPLRGVTHRVGTRVSIGRASSSDIQLVHDGISRQHAEIVTDEHGRHVLVDLDSSNGTFVDGQRIGRQLLGSQTEFEIMGVQLVYETTAEEPIGEDSGLFAIDRLEHDRPGRAEQRHPVVATYGDGTAYPGNFIDDILNYRRLRTRSHRGDQMQVEDREAYDGLERGLRLPHDDSQGRRYFIRFECDIPAKLRFSDRGEMAATVLDMGVDGAKLRVVDHQVDHDAIVWLAIHLVYRGRASTVAFTSRVVWTCKDHVGLGFAGAPDWEQRGHPKLQVRTHMELGEQVRAAREALGRMKMRSGQPSS